MPKLSPTQIKLNTLDLFVVSSALTIVGIRLFLELTGYPQLGSDGLHIAHMLWGGLLLTVALLFMLLSDKPHKFSVAIVGGIGFGFFIDEVGKFVTSDNNYFYQPTALLIYTTLLLIWFVSRLIVVRDEDTPFASDAIWPPKRFEKILIIIFVIAQIISGLLSIILSLLYKNNLSGVSDFMVYMFAAVTTIVSIMYTYGIIKLYFKGFTSKTAGPIRMATIISILAIYPLIFYVSQFSAIFGFVINIAVILALSKTSIKSIFNPVFTKDK